MITVKKDAIKYKDSDGTMKDSGVLCKVSVVGVNWFQHLTTLKDAFKGAVFSEVTEIDIDCTNNLGNRILSFENAFNGIKGVKKIKISAFPVDKAGNAQGYTMYAFFSSCDAEIIDVSGIQPLRPYDIRYIIYNCANLREVIGEFDLSLLLGTNYTTYSFNNALLLEEIRFKKGTIGATMNLSQQGKLSDTSIQSIIDGLSDLTGQTAQTLTFHSIVKSKLTEEQIATITSKNWTLA